MTAAAWITPKVFSHLHSIKIPIKKQVNKYKNDIKKTGIFLISDNSNNNSAGIDTPKRKVMSLKKNGIRITNTTSTELK